MPEPGRLRTRFSRRRAALGRAALLAAVCAQVAACAHGRAFRGVEERFETAVGAFRLAHEPSDAEGAVRVKQAVHASAHALRRWGTLRHEVRLCIVPDHESLERAARRRGYPWLRAWARFDEVYVQSPQSWSGGMPTQRQLDELLLHELTHALMYQLSADRRTWRSRRIPLWFREGMASITADQGHRRMPLPEVRSLLQQHGDALLSGLDEVVQADNTAVYSTAHHAFVYLLERGGDAIVRAILEAMRGGADFDEAFERVVGVPREAFERAFVTFVVDGDWNAWPGPSPGS